MSQQEMAERAHSLISGSKIVRFMCCPSSINKDERDLIDTSPKTAAKEGEKAHDFAEQCLLHGEEALAECRNKLMRSGAMAYREFIRSQARDESGISTERFVCMGYNFGLPNNAIGGYYDAMYEDKNFLHLFDYKFGFHIVEPNTPQLTFYVLARLMGEAFDQGELPFGTTEIKGAVKELVGRRVMKQSIIQPKRKDGIVHTYELSMSELFAFIDKMWKAVDGYCESNGRFVPEQTIGNEYCKYCEKRLFCKNAMIDPSVMDAAPKFKFARRE